MTSGDRHAHAALGARERYAEGCNCAQSVVGAIAELPGLPTLPPTIGAGFTTGIGHKGCVCGALAGGVAVLGEYASAQGLEPVAARLRAEELSATIHTRFTDRFGSACCRVIKRGQVEGSDEWLSGCATITEETAGMVADIVAEHERKAEPRTRWAGRDVMSVANRVALDGLAGGAIALLAALLLPEDLSASAFLAIVASLVLAGVALEVGRPGLRRAGRVLRAFGVVVSAALMLVVSLAPGAARTLAGTALSTSPAAGAARAVLAVCLLVVAGSSLFALKRYR